MRCRLFLPSGRWPASMILAVVLHFDPANALAVTVDWVTVGDPGNACEVQTQGCFGAVAQPYRISRTEVTVSQYTGYLNAVAQSDPNGLFYPAMANWITQSGGSGSYSYSYSSNPGEADRPIGFTTIYHGLRFANWLHNGQPTGPQGNSTTEDGAYTITPAGIAANSIMRNAGATIFLTNEDEWYKAAYYDAMSASYFDYPAGTDTPTGCTAPGPAPNTANCGPALGESSYAGTYTGSASPYGTYDQGGNLWEWVETIGSGPNRVIRGGGFWDGMGDESLSSAVSWEVPGNGVPGTGETADFIGFRVAGIIPIPEPGTGLLLLGGLAGLASRRRHRK